MLQAKYDELLTEKNEEIENLKAQWIKKENTLNKTHKDFIESLQQTFNETLGEKNHLYDTMNTKHSNLIKKVMDQYLTAKMKIPLTEGT